MRKHLKSRLPDEKMFVFASRMPDWPSTSASSRDSTDLITLEGLESPKAIASAHAPGIGGLSKHPARSVTASTPEKRTLSASFGPDKSGFVRIGTGEATLIEATFQ